MRGPFPLFRASSFTPTGGAGLHLAAPSAWSPRVIPRALEQAAGASPALGTAWVHGCLILPEREIARARGAADWLRSLFVTAITEIDGVPIIASVDRPRPSASEPVWARAGSAPLRALPFSLDLGTTLSFRLQPDAYHVHVSARSHASDVLRFERAAAAPPRPERTPVDSLIVGYELFRSGDPVAALPRFEAALGDVSLRSDLDSACLYDGACAAFQAATRAPAAGAERLRTLGLGWLEEDCALRLSAHNASAWSRLWSGRAEEEDESLRRHVEHARVDPDLDPVRDHPDFLRLLVEAPRAR